jgi:hypothetical protein
MYALLRSFDDADPGVRFTAADALSGHGDHAVRPLLRALIDRAHSPWFRESAAHCLSRMSAQGIHTRAGNVVAALFDPRRFILLPMLALDALSNN